MSQLGARSMVSRVRSALGNYDVDLISDDFILQWLNQANRRIILKYPFTEFCNNELITTISGTSEYAMVNTDVMFVENVVNTTRFFDLKRCDETDYDLWTMSARVAGAPTHYFLSSPSGVTGDSRKITFYPTPNSGYIMRVRYQKNPRELALAPAETFSELSSMWDHVLIYAAIADGFMHLSEPDKAQSFMALTSGAEQEAWKTTIATSEVPMNAGRVFRIGIG